MRSKRVEQFSKVMIHHGWRSMSILSSPKDWANPFDIEVWAKGGRVMLAQIWSDGSGVATYFQGGGETWEQLGVELARDTEKKHDPDEIVATFLQLFGILVAIRQDQTSRSMKAEDGVLTEREKTAARHFYDAEIGKQCERIDQLLEQLENILNGKDTNANSHA